MGVFRKVRRAIQRDGLRKAIALCARNLIAGTYEEPESDFDARYGVDTDRRVELGDLKIESPSYPWGAGYAPTPTVVFEWIISALAPRKPRDYTFVDLGCGKGRVVLLAAQEDFRCVIGVDFSADLCRIAESNLGKFQPHIRANKVHIVCEDAVRFEFPPGPLIVYCFNPFDGKILSVVVQRLSERQDETILVHYGECQLPKDFEVIHRAETFGIWKVTGECVT